MIKCNSKAFLSAALFPLAAATVSASDGTIDSGNGFTYQTALSYSVAANWKDGAIAMGEGSVATILTNMWVRIDGDVTLGLLRSSRLYTQLDRPTVFGDGKFTFTAPAAASNPGAHSMIIYADVDYAATEKSNRAYWTLFCGNVSAHSDLIIDGDCQFRADRYAYDNAEVRTNPWPVTRMTVSTPRSADFYAPEGTSQAVAGRWRLYPDSDLAVRVESAAHPLPVGAYVGGEGVQPGTFVKRIFDDKTIQLSRSAIVASETETELTFEAHRSDVRQQLATLRFMNSGVSAIYLNKYRSADGFRFDVADFQTGTAADARVVDTREGFLPGTLVLHGLSNAGGLQLGNAHLELAESATYGENGAAVSQIRAAAFTRITVPENISARISSMTNLIGTVVKDGAGALAIGFTSDVKSNTGSVSVESGTLAFELPSNSEMPIFDQLSLGADAEFSLSGSSVAFRRFKAEAGARITGMGTVYLPEGASTEGITVGDGVTVASLADLTGAVYDDGEYCTSEPLPEVPGTPAFWVDASDEGSFEFAEGSSVDVVVWHDVRSRAGSGGDYPSAAIDTRSPRLVRDVQERGRHVYIQNEISTDDRTQVPALWWSRQFDNVRAVFKVINCRDGGGQFLGGSPQVWRGAGERWTSSVFYEKNATNYAGVAKGVFRVNGEKRDWRTGYAYRGGRDGTEESRLVPLLADFQFAEGVSAGNFGYNTMAGRNGQERIYEFILYTNELTHAQQDSVRQYLMKKWLSAEVEFESVPASDAAEVDDIVAFDVPAGKVARLSGVSGGGVLEKVGEGRLFVEDCADQSLALKVVDGIMSVRSTLLSRDTLPGIPALHLDASDAATVTADETGVSQWSDCRGAGYPTVGVLNDSVRPSINPDGANGLAMMDFAEAVRHVKDGGLERMRDFGFEEIKVRTFFGVYGSQRGNGAVLLGNTTGKTHLDGDELHGIPRIGGGTYDKLDYKLIIPSGLNDFGITRYGAGSTRVFINGEAADLGASVLSGGYDMVSAAMYEPVGMSGFTTSLFNETYTSGCQLLGESIVYTNTLSRTSVRHIEAYLRQKWFGSQTAGLRPARARSLEIADGARLEITGGAPIEVVRLVCNGVIDGGVGLAEGAELHVRTAENHSLSTLQIAGGVDASKGGTLVLVNSQGALASGISRIAKLNRPEVGVWRIEERGLSTKSIYTVRASDGWMVLDVRRPGLGIIVR